MQPIQVQVSYRQIALEARTVLEPRSDGRGFLVSEAPMPVGTLLALTPVAQPARTLSARVLDVVEPRRKGRGPEGQHGGMTVALPAEAAELFAGAGIDAGPGRAKEPTPVETPIVIEAEPSTEPAIDAGAGAARAEAEPASITAAPPETGLGAPATEPASEPSADAGGDADEGSAEESDSTAPTDDDGAAEKKKRASRRRRKKR